MVTHAYSYVPTGVKTREKLACTVPVNSYIRYLLLYSLVDFIISTLKKVDSERLGQCHAVSGVDLNLV